MSEIKSVDEAADRVAESVRRALLLVGHAENGVEHVAEVPEDVAVS